MTKDDRIMCVMCAWRGTCAKKFSISAAELLHCIDYSRDVTIKPIPEDDEDTLVVIKPKKKEKEDHPEDAKDEGEDNQ